MFTDFAESQAVLLIAGGSGITFAAAIFEELTGAAAAGHIRARTLILVWCVFSFEFIA